MNIEEHLLVCLIEECAEVQKEATKALRFSLDDRFGIQTVREKLTSELHDLAALIEMLSLHGVITSPVDRDKIEAKKSKVLGFMQYARERKTLV